MNVPLLQVDGLTVAYRRGEGWVRVVEDVSFSIGAGEVLGLVGESGCGKSTVALQLLGYRHPGLRVEAGRVTLNDLNLTGHNLTGQNLTDLPRAELDRLRGRHISFVPQNPTTALNPGMRVGAQVGESLRAHGNAADTDPGALFAQVGLPDDQAFRRRYPHQLSGGQQQRVCIAMALACGPDLLVLDEPTTGLDVTTQAQIVALLADLRARLGMSMLYVTHDLTLLSQLADRVGVMYAGRLVEIAETGSLFRTPRHPYTKGLIAAIPQAPGNAGFGTRPLRGLLQRGALPPGCPFTPRCDHARPGCAETVQRLTPAGAAHQTACWRASQLMHEPQVAAPEPPRRAPARNETLIEVKGLSVAYGIAAPVVRDVSFTLGIGETLALVGESGSGKSTIARAIAGLLAPVTGEVLLRNAPLEPLVRLRSREVRRRIQLIFQNPDASLNPRARLATTLRRPVDYFFPVEAHHSLQLAQKALDQVRLETAFARRFPDELSGGERQRAAIARALLARPDVLLCDEVLSALDVSVQASILLLLQRLTRESGIAMLFISHDLAVVRLVADRIAVLFRGEIMEIGTADRVFAAPFHPYTHALLQAVPKPLVRLADRARMAGAPVGVAPAPGRGCAYAGRCGWKPGPLCDTTMPPWQTAPGGLRIRCHLTPEALSARAAETQPEEILA